MTPVSRLGARGRTFPTSSGRTTRESLTRLKQRTPATASKSDVTSKQAKRSGRRQERAETAVQSATEETADDEAMKPATPDVSRKSSSRKSRSRATDNVVVEESVSGDVSANDDVTMSNDGGDEAK